MRRKANLKTIYYFSEKLKRQLGQIPRFPLTLVEAPSGFGKTTAVREYLKENRPDGAHEYWYTCLGESRFIAWGGICTLLAYADPGVADSLKNLGMPSADTLEYMIEILRGFNCSEEIYLVIDNYQLVGCDIPHELINVFSLHGSPNLHMVFIAQNLGMKPRITFHNACVHTIESPVFFFDKVSTANLFRMEGIHLTDDELNKVYSNTEGWVFAIRLQMMGYEQTGSFDFTADIIQLVETAIWSRLMPEEKEFLISVSVIGSFTVREAATIMNKEALPDNIMSLLSSNDFIKFFPKENIYNIHSILRDYLQNQFNHQPEVFQKRILRITGQCYAAKLQLLTAARFFLELKDFDSILSLPFDVIYLANQREKNMLEFAVTVMTECPEETLCKYPFSILMFAYAILMSGNMEILQKGCRLISLAIKKNTAGFSSKELKRLMGEFVMLRSIMEHNDIRKMSEGVKAAYALLEGPSIIVSRDMPYTFGSTSVLCLFWRESGKLDETIRYMEESPYQRRLTGGRDSGIDSAIRAEVMLMRGEDEQAEILCHKALYKARSKQQTSICLCAELILARIAILRGDADGYSASVENIKAYAKENSHLYVLRMVDLCISVLGFVLNIPDMVANRFCDLESIEKTVYAPAIPYVQIIYSNFLLREKRYTEFYGLSPLVMETAKNMNYIFPQMYQHILLAEAKYAEGNSQEAVRHLDKALGLALPDGLYLPFALQWGTLGDLLESIRGSSAVLSERSGSFDALMALRRRQIKGVNIIRKALQRIQSPLTPREREVALLTRDRLSRKEIAEKLYISEKTVRTILYNVYNKLEIHSKYELQSKKF